jgi:hypothetical protein
MPTKPAAQAATSSSSSSPATGGVPFQHSKVRFTIGSLDDENLTVEAHYNPAELGRKKAITWEAHGSQQSRKQTSSTQDSHEYKGQPVRTMSIDLLFDGYETNTSIEPIVDMLEELSTVRDPESKNPEFKRPHYCVAKWGSELKAFRCVITSLAVRYTMFDRAGRPLRATCTVELTEARLQSAGAVSAATRDAGEAMRAAFARVVG